MRVQVPNGTALLMHFKESTPGACSGAYSDPIQPDVDHHLRFQFILEHARDIVLFVRADDGRIIEANPAAQTAYGYTYDELLALHITDLRAPKTLGMVAQQMAQADEEGIQFETVHRRKDGSLFPVEVSSVGAMVEGTRVLMSTIRTRKHVGEAVWQPLQAMAAPPQEPASLLAEIRRQAAQLTAARESSMLLAETLALPDIYARLYSVVQTVLPDTATFFIALFDEINQCTVAAYGVQDGQVLDVSGLPPLPLRGPAEGTQSRVIHSRQPLIMNDLQKQLGKPGSIAVKVGADEKYTHSALYVPMLAKGRVAGVMQVQSYAPGRYTPSDADLLSFIGNTAAIAILNAQLVEQMQHYDRELELACDSALESWSRTLDLRDKETEDHTRRVSALTVRLARAMGVCERDIVHVRRGARLHDIGKVGIPDSILHKPGPLTAEEWQVMKQHPTLAYELLAPLEQMRPALDIPYCHHEKWDGTGYPRGLKGEEIPLAARIFTVVDVWDALCSDRPYRKALPPDQALALIRAEAGTHFDPAVVRTFLSALKE